jgi:flavin-dependent dehydrogenase
MFGLGSQRVIKLHIAALSKRRKGIPTVSLKLGQQPKIAVVGAGPAGAFFAHFMLALGERQGIKPDITLFDRKSFLDAGPKGCNMCAGAIGHHLVEHMRLENIPLPQNVIRQEVDGYVLHAGDGQVYLRQDERPIYTVFRGGSPGPSRSEVISFDQFLLDSVISMGATFVQERISEVDWPQDSSERVIVKTQSGATSEADLVVGAFGVNTGLHRKFMPDSRPPKTWVACQAEMPVEADFSKRVLGNNIHVFAFGRKKINFLALTPKSNFITFSAIGPWVRMSDLEEALSLPELRPFLPEGWKITCHCHPRLPTTAAGRPFRDRGLLVGDACQARYMKSGIESAYFTSLFAAETCLVNGIAERDLREYQRLCKKRFGIDNQCGKVLYAIQNAVTGKYRLARAHGLAIELEKIRKSRDKQVLANSLWSLFTGDEPYRSILKNLFRPSIQSKLIIAGLHSLVRTRSGWRRHVERKLARHRTRVDRGLLLKDGSTVAIIGGGPGGASCAMRLLEKAHKEDMTIRVVIFEGKDFDRHYNQCVGALSPPLERLLREKMEIDLPEELIKRRIESYQIYSDGSNVFLEGRRDADPTYAVRRVMFDRFMLEKAEEAGADIVRSRVTGVEFVHTDELDEVRIYAESQYLKADVVVGAFGLDRAMLDCWEQATKVLSPYRRPQKLLKTFITKIHTDPAFIETTLGNSIHAFLLSGPRIEFGAITPKGDHIIINIAGKDVSSLDLDSFLEQPQVSEMLPELDYEFIDYYEGYFPTSRATNPYGRRYVLVGDATGWMRPFKGKGINTAVITGLRAADTIFEHGFSREALKSYAKSCADLRRDYYYGLIVRHLCRIGRSLGLFDSTLRVAASDPGLREILYMAVSGEDSYRDIFLRLLKPATLRKLVTSSGRQLLKRMRPSRAAASL